MIYFKKSPSFLVSLYKNEMEKICPSERAERFKTFEKRLVILLYWLAAQQQTRAIRHHKYGLFYLEFDVELN